MSLNRYLKSHTLQFHSVYQSDTAFLIIHTAKIRYFTHYGCCDTTLFLCHPSFLTKKKQSHGNLTRSYRATLILSGKDYRSASSFQYFLAAHDIHARTQTIQSLGNRHSCLHPHTGKQQKIFKSKTHSLHFLDQMHSPNIGLTICQNLPHENRPLAGSSGTNRK